MTQAARRARKRQPITNNNLNWAGDAELVGLVLELVPKTAAGLPLQYSVGLHAWFLDQVRQIDPELSAYLHDGESEKPFTISGLDGILLPQGRQLQLQADQSYRWYVTGLSQRVVNWLARWLQALPQEVALRQAPLQIRSWAIAHPATTYAQLFAEPISSPTINLSFLTPTSFRRKGHHLPLPWPINVFHSYLRRWNDFSGMPFEQEGFLNWIDETAIIHRHRLESVKVAAGKRGSVTGFTGAIEFGLSKEGRLKLGRSTEYEQLFYALGRLAPYAGTGHKTTFGLGQTRLGWLFEQVQAVPPIESLLAQRIAQLTEVFLSQRQRLGGNRARDIAENLATILARRELGESLQDIAEDLEMPYETVKTYAKLARRSLRVVEDGEVKELSL